MTWGRANILLLVGAWPALAQTAADFFNDNILHEIRITINPSDWRRLQENFLDNTYYPAIFQWRDQVIENIGIRSKGRTSRRASKPGLRVDFNRFEELEFLGLKSCLLDNDVSDFTFIKERLVMQLFGRMGLPYLKETHTRLYVNNEYAGVYTLAESTDKRLLKNTYGEEDGYLYEYDYVEPYRFEYRGDDPELYSPRMFKPVTHEKDPDPRPLVNMIRTFNEASDAGFVSAASEYIDLRKFLTHVAVEAWAAEYDGILSDAGMNNFFLYRFEKKNLSQFIAKDKDNTFTLVDYPVLRNINDNVLVRRALATPELRSFFYSEIVRAGEIAGGPGGWLDQEIDREYGQIRDAAYQDSKKECPEGVCSLPQSNEEFEKGIAYLKRFVRERHEIVRLELASAGYTVSPPTNTPRLVQGAAVNAATNSGTVVAPGSLVALYGTNLSSSTATAAVPWPTTLASATVEVNGIPAPLYFASTGQVNFQIPWEISVGQARVQAVVGGLRSEVISVNIGAVSPGIFAVVNADGSLVAGNRAAAAGDVIVVYANGLGQVTNRPDSGRGAPGGPLSTTIETTTSTIGGVNATVVFSGLTPGFVGLYQVNISVPTGIAPGASTPLVLSIGGQSSPPVTIATR